MYPPLLLGLVVFWLGAGLVYVWASAARKNEQYGSDFVVYYAAGRLALDGNAERAYDVRSIHREEERAVGTADAFPYYYPPPYQLIVAPLAAIPYSAALAVWIAAGLAAGGAVLRRVVWPWSAGLGLAWVVPAFIGVGFGQNGLLTAALLGGALASLDNRPGLSGLLLGGLVYKPQFLAVVVVGMVVGRRWRALGVAAGTATVLSAVSLFVFGPDVWREFFGSLGAASDSLYQREGSEKMPGMLAAGVTLGLPPLTSQLLHATLAIPCLGLAAWTWRANVSPTTRNAATVLATILVSPYAFVYDLPVLMLVTGWMWKEAREEGGWIPIKGWLLAGCVTSPGWSWALADSTSVQVGWLPMVALLVVLAVGRNGNAKADGARASPLRPPVRPPLAF